MDKLVTIATFDSPAEAQAMKFLLEEQGFEVFLADDKLALTLSNAVGAAKLQVLESKAQLAARFVEENRQRARRRSHGSDKPDITFACEECGQTLCVPGNRRGGVETCPHCGEYVDVPD
jgi:hypothetical protein